MKFLYSFIFLFIVNIVNAQPSVMPTLPVAPDPPVPVGNAQLTVVHTTDYYVYYIDRQLTWALSLKTGNWFFYKNGQWSKPVHQHKWEKSTPKTNTDFPRVTEESGNYKWVQQPDHNWFIMYEGDKITWCHNAESRKWWQFVDGKWQEREAPKNPFKQ